MEIFILSFLIVLAAAAAMAAGLVLGGAPLKGSCATLDADTICETCGRAGGACRKDPGSSPAP